VAVLIFAENDCSCDTEALHDEVLEAVSVVDCVSVNTAEGVGVCNGSWVSVRDLEDVLCVVGEGVTLKLLGTVSDGVDVRVAERVGLSDDVTDKLLVLVISTDTDIFEVSDTAEEDLDGEGVAEVVLEPCSVGLSLTDSDEFKVYDAFPVKELVGDTLMDADSVAETDTETVVE
jgi:hypothetical protein